MWFSGWWCRSFVDGYQRIGETYSPIFRVEMEVIRLSERLPTMYKTTWHHYQDHNPHFDRFDNTKSHVINWFLIVSFTSCHNCFPSWPEWLEQNVYYWTVQWSTFKNDRNSRDLYIRWQKCKSQLGSCIEWGIWSCKLLQSYARQCCFSIDVNWLLNWKSSFLRDPYVFGVVQAVGWSSRAAVLNLWSADPWGSATPTQRVRDCLGN
jgi:hypothetical protein